MLQETFVPVVYCGRIRYGEGTYCYSYDNALEVLEEMLRLSEGYGFYGMVEKRLYLEK